MSGIERIHATIRGANSEGRAALVIYLPAGFPTMDASRACLEAAVDAATEFGGLDCLVNNAGIHIRRLGNRATSTSASWIAATIRPDR